MGAKRFLYIFILIFSLGLFAFQNCSPIESYGNGKPYEGIGDDGTTSSPPVPIDGGGPPPDTPGIDPSNGQGASPSQCQVPKNDFIDQVAFSEVEGAQRITLFVIGTGGEDVVLSDITMNGSFNSINSDLNNSVNIYGVHYFSSESLLTIYLSVNGSQRTLAVDCGPSSRD